MKQVSEMPKSGQFVAVWTGQTGKIWSDTLMFIGENIFSYEEFNEDNEECHFFCRPEDKSFYIEVGAIYFISD